MSGRARVEGPARVALLERDQELRALTEAIERASEGMGTLVLVEGAAGVGKSCLLRVATERARALELRCLQGRGAELEREMAFGVARQLLWPALSELEASEREHLLGGMAVGAEALLRPAGAPGAEPADQAALVDALYWLVYELAHFWRDASRGRGAMIAIDDAQWSDASTLRWAVRLAVGLEDLPVAVVVAMRSDELERKGPLARLRADPAARILRPAALSDEGVAILVRSELGDDAAEELCRECARVTGGNPFLVRELVASLRADGVAPTAEAAAGLAGMVPDSVLRSVLLRLARLPADAVALAEAAAVLGPGASLGVAAAVAELGADGRDAADALVRTGILRSADPLSFTHPLIASAVAADMAQRSRVRAHRRAAETLAAERAPDERVAAHLRLTPPRGDPWVVTVLRAAASVAITRGDAGVAARLLERALAEPPPAEVRSSVLFELAEAEAASGLPSAVERLAEARDASDDPHQRARALQAMSRLLFARGDVHAAVSAAERGRAELEADDPLALRILASQLAVMFFVPGAWSKARGHLAELDALFEAGHLPHHPLLLAQLATYRGVWRAEGPDRLRPLAEAALAATSGANEVWQGDASMASALIFVGEARLAERVLERMAAYARRTGSPIHAAMTAHWRGALRFQQGWVADAAGEAERVLEVHDLGWGFETMWAAALLAQARLELSDLDGARAAIETGLRADPAHLPYGFVLYARGELSLAAGDAEGALRDFEAAGAHLHERYALSNPAVVPWRAGAVAALVALGDRSGAQQLARTELAESRRTAVPHAVGGALRAAATASDDGEERMALLREAVEVLAPSGAELEHARALCDLGTALRQARQPRPARDALERALQLARRLGATATAQCAYRELRRSGGRPRRAHGGDQAGDLTPGERRVAELAAQDLSNAQIAKRLFLTPRTVEWHLTQTYRKLGIRSRAGLVNALRPQEADEALSPRGGD